MKGVSPKLMSAVVRELATSYQDREKATKAVRQTARALARLSKKLTRVSTKRYAPPAHSRKMQKKKPVAPQ